MKAVILVLLLSCISAVVTGASCDALREYGLSESQIHVMYDSYQFGKSYDMAYSLAAIAYVESSAGVNLYNFRTKVAGVHQVKATHVIQYFGIEDTHDNRLLAMEMLASNFYLSAKLAVDVLGWWLERHDGNWTLAYASYNAGYYWWPQHRQTRYTAAHRYAGKVNSMINKIKQCNWG